MYFVKFEADGNVCSWFSIVVGCRTIFDVNACGFLSMNLDNFINLDSCK